MSAGRAAAALVVALSAAVVGVTAASAASEPLVVDIDRATVIQLPAKAQTLVVGNPIIADVTLLKGGSTLVITGKGYGETNLVVLDEDGKLLAEEIIRVKAGSGANLVVQRGTERESYSCAPRCEPVAELGDGRSFSESSVQINARNGMATPPKR